MPPSPTALIMQGPQAHAARSSSLDDLARSAEENGWRAAALEVQGRDFSLFRYIGDERAADWRFLLPALPRERALLFGGALSPVSLSLARTCERVDVVGEPQELRFLEVRAREEGVHNIRAISPADVPRGEEYGLVAALRRVPASGAYGWSLSNLQSIIRRTEPGGSFYIEIERPAVLHPPFIMKRRLRRLGISGTRLYWPKPTFATCEMLIPLGDRRLQRYYLSDLFFAMSPTRRVLLGALRAVTRLGLFELSLPQYLVVARRSGAEL